MRALVVTVVSLVAAAAHAGTPAAIVIPPMEIDVGAGAPLGSRDPNAMTTEFRIGFHTASLYWKPTRFDVGIGYVASSRALASDGVLARSVEMTEEPSLTMHGLYASVAYAIERHRHWRTWLGGRVESLRGNYYGRSIVALGGSVRLGAEVFAAGVNGASSGGSGAFAAGSWALGVYVEGTLRTLPDDLGAFGLGAGVSMRVPFIIAAGR